MRFATKVTRVPPENPCKAFKFIKNPEITIRHMNNDDCDRVSDLLLEGYHDDYNFSFGEGKDELKKSYVRESLRANSVFFPTTLVAEKDNKVLGVMRHYLPEE